MFNADLTHMAFAKQHIDWILFILLAAIFVIFPQIDLSVSRWFYDAEQGRWPLANGHVPCCLGWLWRKVAGC